jgi:hypothetical protein
VSCPGLHCPGCSEGQSLGILAGAVVVLAAAGQVVQWVAERIWWIGGTLAVCFALAVAAGMWLERLADRRGARFAAAHGILSRTDVMLAQPPPQRPAIEQHVHHHYHAADGEQPAAIEPPHVYLNVTPDQLAVIMRHYAREKE